MTFPDQSIEDGHTYNTHSFHTPSQHSSRRDPPPPTTDPRVLERLLARHSAATFSTNSIPTGTAGGGVGAGAGATTSLDLASISDLDVSDVDLNVDNVRAEYATTSPNTDTNNPVSRQMNTAREAEGGKMGDHLSDFYKALKDKERSELDASGHGFASPNSARSAAVRSSFSPERLTQLSGRGAREGSLSPAERIVKCAGEEPSHLAAIQVGGGSDIYFKAHEGGYGSRLDDCDGSQISRQDGLRTSEYMDGGADDDVQLRQRSAKWEESQMVSGNVLRGPHSGRLGPSRERHHSDHIVGRVVSMGAEKKVERKDETFERVQTTAGRSPRDEQDCQRPHRLESSHYMDGFGNPDASAVRQNLSSPVALLREPNLSPIRARPHPFENSVVGGVSGNGGNLGISLTGIDLSNVSFAVGGEAYLQNPHDGLSSPSQSQPKDMDAHHRNLSGHDNTIINATDNDGAQRGTTIMTAENRSSSPKSWILGSSVLNFRNTSAGNTMSKTIEKDQRRLNINNDLSMKQRSKYGVEGEPDVRQHHRGGQSGVDNENLRLPSVAGSAKDPLDVDFDELLGGSASSTLPNPQLLRKYLRDQRHTVRSLQEGVDELRTLVSTKIGWPDFSKRLGNKCDARELHDIANRVKDLEVAVESLTHDQKRQQSRSRSRSPSPGPGRSSRGRSRSRSPGPRSLSPRGVRFGGAAENEIQNIVDARMQQFVQDQMAKQMEKMKEEIRDELIMLVTSCSKHGSCADFSVIDDTADGSLHTNSKKANKSQQVREDPIISEIKKFIEPQIAGLNTQVQLLSAASISSPATSAREVPKKVEKLLVQVDKLHENCLSLQHQIGQASKSIRTLESQRGRMGEVGNLLESLGRQHIENSNKFADIGKRINKLEAKTERVEVFVAKEIKAGSGGRSSSKSNSRKAHTIPEESESEASSADDDTKHTSSKSPHKSSKKAKKTPSSIPSKLNSEIRRYLKDHRVMTRDEVDDALDAFRTEFRGKEGAVLERVPLLESGLVDARSRIEALFVHNKRLQDLVEVHILEEEGRGRSCSPRHTNGKGTSESPSSILKKDGVGQQQKKGQSSKQSSQAQLLMEKEQQQPQQQAVESAFLKWLELLEIAISKTSALGLKKEEPCDDGEARNVADPVKKKTEAVITSLQTFVRETAMRTALGEDDRFRRRLESLSDAQGEMHRDLVRFDRCYRELRDTVDGLRKGYIRAEDGTTLTAEGACDPATDYGIDGEDRNSTSITGKPTKVIDVLGPQALRQVQSFVNKQVSSSLSSLQKLLTAKVDTAVLEELMRHIATREEIKKTVDQRLNRYMNGNSSGSANNNGGNKTNDHIFGSIIGVFEGKLSTLRADIQSINGFQSQLRREMDELKKEPVMAKDRQNSQHQVKTKGGSGSRSDVSMQQDMLAQVRKLVEERVLDRTTSLRNDLNATMSSVKAELFRVLQRQQRREQRQKAKSRDAGPGNDEDYNVIPTRDRVDDEESATNDSSDHVAEGDAGMADVPVAAESESIDQVLSVDGEKYPQQRRSNGSLCSDGANEHGGGRHDFFTQQQQLQHYSASALTNLAKKLTRDFDEKLFLVCSDLSACKAAYQQTLLARRMGGCYQQCGQWLWKSGTLKFGSAVPWNYETLNTDPDNFKWDQESTSIKVGEPGLYEITFGFFTKLKPSIQLVVNGESVLSAINSPSYVVHHGSGFVVSGEGRMEPGSVSGLSLLVAYCFHFSDF
ncbi:hypothetical protein HK102_009959 [Quaeritorhiza haematococci]|nr:hypothetical protein HK102_009959 [Quaeritorhiza haematococci]